MIPIGVKLTNLNLVITTLLENMDLALQVHLHHSAPRNACLDILLLGRKISITLAKFTLLNLKLLPFKLK